ncbi:MAG: hypothetical protein ABIR79_10500 [Candidatus Binatia bacterium]
MRSTLAAVVTALTLATGPAMAGIVDTPVPAGTKFLYSVPGVMNTPTGFGTFFACTNADKKDATIGVEVFGAAGGAPLNVLATTSVSVAVGATVMIGTRDAAGGGFVLDQNLDLATTLTRGSARILASSTKFLCTAFVVDAVGFTGTSWPLNVVAKAKQKAAN